jgi:hypothetical protein
MSGSGKLHRSILRPGQRRLWAEYERPTVRPYSKQGDRHEWQVGLLVAKWALRSTTTDPIANPTLASDRIIDTFNLRKWPERARAAPIAQDSARWDWQLDFGLEVKYLRRVSEQRTVDARIRELKRMGMNLGPGLLSALEARFETGTKGNGLIAIPRDADQMFFWFNERPTCELRDPGVNRSFLGILLGDNTWSKSLSQARRRK